MSIFDAGDLRSTFERYCDQLNSDFDFGKLEAIRAVAKLKTKPDAARTVIGIGIGVGIGAIIGGSGGNFDADEKVGPAPGLLRGRHRPGRVRPWLTQPPPAAPATLP